MEDNLHSINSMKNMEIIEVNSGKKIGYIEDIKLDCENDKVVALILPGENKGWFNKDDDIEIPWENIKKIGEDVILVSLENYNYSDNSNRYR